MADALDLLRAVVTSGAGWRGADPAPITVLLLADEAACRRALQAALQNQGMNVTECAGTTEAFDHLRDTPFDVIFLDAPLAEMDSEVFSTELRRLPFHGATPLVLLTSEPDFGSRFEALLDEGCDFIAKPIVPSEAAVKAFAFALKYRLDPRPGRKAAARVKSLPPLPKGAPGTIAASEDAAVPDIPRASPPAQKVERQAKEPAVRPGQASARLEGELAARTLQFQQVQEQAAELDKTRQALSAELGKSTRRESRLKQQCAEWEQQLEALNQSLGRLGKELAQENERRRAAEQQASQLTRRLEEMARAENASRQQLAQMARDHGEELARLRAVLDQETEARERAEQTGADLAATHARLEKQLAEGWSQAQDARERYTAAHQALKAVLAESQRALARQSQLQQDLAALDEPLRNLSHKLRPPK
jgi:DNA-binding response OmpR family regulator